MIGLETEYGIYVETKGAADLVDESARLVAAYPGIAATGWDYTRERPRRDMRGFTVDALSIDPTDAQFERSGMPHSTSAEARNDRMLTNGARLYNDHGHPEYSTPECATIRSLVAHDRAGERIMQMCADARSRQMNGGLVALYKNNTDFHGASYGMHESYLMSRGVPFETLLSTMLPFFVTRQIFAGAGKAGIEAGTSGVSAKGNVFQLSQRADFFTTTASVDTLYNRPIVNTRDEPHADPKRFRRFHVICGDANMMETSTFLKVGTTLLVLRLLEQGFVPDGVALRDPVAAIKHISRDTSWKWLVERDGGGTVGAVAIQRAYLSLAQERLQGFSDETDQVIREWARVLDSLESDPLSLSDTLDWVAKYSLLSEYRESENLPWDDDALLSLDLEYHNVDPDAGLYYALEQEERVRRIVTEDDIALAVNNAPNDSPRPVVRGIAVRKFARVMRDLSWSRFTLDDGGQSAVVQLGMTDELDVLSLADTLEKTDAAGAFVAALHDASDAAQRDKVMNPEAVLIAEA